MKKLKTAFISLLCLSCMTISNKGSASNPVLRISDGWVADTIAPALIHYRFAGYDSISQAHQNVDVLEVDLTSPSYDIQLVYEEHGDSLSSSNERYFCPYCHSEMIAKRGNIRQWHFAHKADKCSYDKYLHSIAEIMIMNWFNQKEHIILSMDSYEKCDKYDNCVFYDKINCKRVKKVQFDLKTYYSKCIQEHRCRDFIADLYCENKTNPNLPIFIEVFVTHECSQEKKKSGIRIIELSIQSEEDILDIVNSTNLNECEKVKLHNFKRKEVLAEDFAQPFQKYILHHTLKSYVERDTFTCRNYNHHRKGIYEISMPYDDCIPYFINSGGLYTIGKVKAYLDGYLKKDCQLCKWQAEDMSGSKFCKLYKKCGNPKYCNDNDVSKCSMFRENTLMINDAISDFNEYQKNDSVDIWNIDTPY